MIVFKQIKPKRLREKELRLELLNAVRQAGRDIKKDFERTTSTWEHKPKFEIIISLQNGPQVLVWTDDEIYNYVSGGTEEHIIEAVNAKALRFREGFVAKTRPGSLISIAGASYGKVVMRAWVTHPGTEAREFDKLVKAKWEKPFRGRMEKAMREAAKKSGHAM